MEPRYLTWNFANFVSVNLMVAVLTAIIVLALRWNNKGPAAAA